MNHTDFGGALDHYADGGEVEGRITPTPSERRKRRQQRADEPKPAGSTLVPDEIEEFKRQHYNPALYGASVLGRAGQGIESLLGNMTTRDALDMINPDPHLRDSWGPIAAPLDLAGIGANITGVGRLGRVAKPVLDEVGRLGARALEHAPKPTMGGFMARGLMDLPGGDSEQPQAEAEGMNAPEYESYFNPYEDARRDREGYDEGGQVDNSGPDYTDSYNTQLAPAEEQAYQIWARDNNRLNDSADYDMRGAWKAGIGSDPRGHFPDTYKKPNHPTFSDESMYHGVDGYQGGHWGTDGAGRSTFTPGATNLKQGDVGLLRNYLSRVDPDVQLTMPQGYAGGGSVYPEDTQGALSQLYPGFNPFQNVVYQPVPPRVQQPGVVPVSGFNPSSTPTPGAGEHTFNQPSTIPSPVSVAPPTVAPGATADGSTPPPPAPLFMQAPPPGGQGGTAGQGTTGSGVTGENAQATNANPGMAPGMVGMPTNTAGVASKIAQMVPTLVPTLTPAALPLMIAVAMARNTPNAVTGRTVSVANDAATNNAAADAAAISQGIGKSGHADSLETNPGPTAPSKSGATGVSATGADAAAAGMAAGVSSAAPAPGVGVGVGPSGPSAPGAPSADTGTSDAGTAAAAASSAAADASASAAASSAAAGAASSAASGAGAGATGDAGNADGSAAAAAAAAADAAADASATGDSGAATGDASSGTGGGAGASGDAGNADGSAAAAAAAADAAAADASAEGDSGAAGAGAGPGDAGPGDSGPGSSADGNGAATSARGGYIDIDRIDRLHKALGGAVTRSDVVHDSDGPPISPYGEDFKGALSLLYPENAPRDDSSDVQVAGPATALEKIRKLAFKMHPEENMHIEERLNTGFGPRERPLVKPTKEINWPGIWESPRSIAEEAATRVAPENGALSQVFGVNRDDIYGMSQGRKGNVEGSSLLRLGPKPRGSEYASAVTTSRNAQRLQDILGEAETFPDLQKGMDSWYTMDPAYNRLVQLYGPEEAKARFNRLNAFTAMSSPGSNVETEINRGTAANALDRAGRFDDFKKFGGLDEVTRGEIPGGPTDMQNVTAHPYHSTAHVGPMERYRAAGEMDMDSAKVPLYYGASGVPETGFQTDLPVGDAHFTRGIGVGDVRDNANPGASMKKSLYQHIGPWFRDNVASPMGLESVPAQGRLWGTLGHATGVDSAIGAPKIELLAKHIVQRAHELGISVEEARDMILSGEGFDEGGYVDDDLPVGALG